MDCITLSASRTATAAFLATCSLTLSTHATEPSQWHPLSMMANTSSAVLRDNEMKDVRPCLIGIRNCASMYPRPTLCLVSTARCPADARLQLAGSEQRVSQFPAPSESLSFVSSTPKRESLFKLLSSGSQAMPLSPLSRCW